MKNIKNAIALLVLVGILGVGSSFAKGGVIVTGNLEQPCVEKAEGKDWGVIVINFLKGIVGDDSQTTEETTNCGVIVIQ